MNIIKRRLCFILALCISISVFSQSGSIWKLDMRDGLSNNYVVGITQDQQGCLWFATESGLNRFDGRNFSVYTKYHSGLAANELNQVIADKKLPVIWIATQREGLCEYNYQTNTFTTYTCEAPGDNKIVTNDVTDLKHAADGGIWINTYHWGVEHFDPENKKFTHYNKNNVKNLVSQQTWTSADDGKGNLYVGHPFHGMSIISLKDRTARNFRHQPEKSNSIPGDNVRSICIDHNGNVWVGTTNGLAFFNPQTEEFITIKHTEGKAQSLLSNEVYSIHQMNDGKLWIGTFLGGISIFDPSLDVSLSPENVTFKNILPADNESGLSGNNVRSIFEDSYGNMWIGDYGNGISCIPHIQPPFSIWKHISNSTSGNNLSHSTVWGLFMDSEQKLWIGVEGAIDLFDNQGRIGKFLAKEYNANQRLPLAAILEDSRKNVWLGLYQGDVRVYNRKTHEFKTLQLDEQAESDVRCFYESPDGIIWIGTQTGLYSYFPIEKTIYKEAEINKQLPDHMIRSILQDKDGNLWVATFGKGICIFNRKKELIWNFVTATGFCSNAVNYLYRDSQQRIWGGTREGLVCFTETRTPDKYIVYKESQGLEYCYIHAISEDREGNIWISANGGISCYNEREKRFYNYNHTDRTSMGDFMDGSVAKGADGTIYFGSQYGVCYFQPQEVMGKQELAKVVITDFAIYHSQTEYKENESRPVMGREVEIPFHQNTFRITFNVPDYSQSSRVEYAYMLEGLENSWYDTNGENQVTFRNIPYGTYTFRVKARIRNQEYDLEQALFKIQINPPLWLTWWAKTLYVLIIATMIWLIARFYKRKLNLENSLQFEKTSHQQEQELNNERLRFYTNITHELRTPLTLILGPLEDMMSDPTFPEKHGRKISLIHQSATLLLNLINQILEFRKTETQNKKLCVCRGDIARLIRGIGLSYIELNKNPKVKISINIETEQVVLFFDADIITIILNNLLSNAVKYTEEGRISITLRSVHENDIDYTEIEVSDTGFGIPPESLEHIFERYYQVGGVHSASGTGIGLALVKNLVVVHQGEINVASEVNKGTTFRMRLLTANTYPDALHADFDNAGSKQMEAEIQEEEAEQKELKPLVLVIEDNTNIRQYIVDAFSDFYEVITATNGKEGLDMAFTRIPNIVISDIMMPVMDGIEVCKKLKEDVRTSHVPIILLTAKDSLSDKEEGYSAGADSYLTKPFSANLLHSRVDNLLKSRKELAGKVLSTDMTDKPASISNNVLSKLDKDFIDKITRIIEENMQSDKMDVAFIAEKMFMSHSTLYRKIKGLTDMSANEFVRKVKMRYAERMLSTGEYTTTEIAYMVGINSVTYFRQCFKDEFGVSPSEYLKGGSR